MQSIREIWSTSLGSLPRPDSLLNLLAAKEAREPVDQKQFGDLERQAVFEAVARQKTIGIRLPTNGEMGRPSFAAYVKDRWTGFDGPNTPWIARDLAAHPDLGAFLFQEVRVKINHPSCTGEITVRDPEAVHRDIELFQAALLAAGYEQHEGVMTAPGPGVIATNMRNRFFSSQRAYLDAIGQALRHEYQAIAQAGLILQVDCPDLFLARHVAKPESSWEEPVYRTHEEYMLHVQQSSATLQEALEGIPAEQIRVHVCNGNHPGTHEFDVHAEEILDLLLELPGTTLCLEAAATQHQRDFLSIEARMRQGRWPAAKRVVRGVIDTKSPGLEPVEVVAQRIVDWAGFVWWDPIIVGMDCGLTTYAGFPHHLPSSVAWAKLQRLAEGALAAEKAFSAVAGTHPRVPSE